MHDDLNACIAGSLELAVCLQDLMPMTWPLDNWNS